MAELVLNTGNERSVASRLTSVLSGAALKQRKGRSEHVVTLRLQKPDNTFSMKSCQRTKVLGVYN